MRYLPDVTIVHHDSQFNTDVHEMWRAGHRYWRKHHPRVGARVAALATGLQYLCGAAVGVVCGAAVGVVVGDAGYIAPVRLHARSDWHVQAPGLREPAEEWSSAHDD